MDTVISSIGHEPSALSELQRALAPLTHIDVAPLLRARLTVDYPDRPGVLRGTRLDVYPGELLGLIGESGSGKTTLSLALLGLLPARSRVEGEVQLGERNLLTCRARELRSVLGRDLAFVPQSSVAALNPALKLRTHFREVWRAHRAPDRKLEEARFRELLSQTQLPDDASFLDRYPRQLSVGQAQRVLIAMALLHRPRLLIADEPTSALDLITQAEILKLFMRINREDGTAILLISHDLYAVAAVCERVAILREGEIVETGKTSEVFEHPCHPYTAQLLAALPSRLCPGLPAA